MDVILHSILPFLAILSVLVVVHELGHYITAKIAGVKVLEFAIGYPPRIFAIKLGETEYAINILPLGGYVRLLGEEDPNDPASLAAKPRWIRLVVLGSGAVMNVFLAVFLFSMALMIPRTVDVSRSAISEVIPNSPADHAGLEPGDVIFAVNGTNVNGVGELGYQIRLNLGKTIDLRVKPANTTGREIDDSDGDGFVTIPVHARWSAGPYTYETAIANGASIGANEQTPIPLNVESTEDFRNGSILTIDNGSANEEVFEYCVDSTSTLILMERGLDGTMPSAHNAGAPVTHKVNQGPTGISIGPAYTTVLRLTDEQRAELEKHRTPCDDEIPAFVAAPSIDTKSSGPITAVIDGSKRSWESLVLARNELLSKIRGGVGGGSGFQLTGPVGIAQLTGEVVEEAGWKSLMEFAGLISINLAILNILPLPMLDGGRMVFVLIEIVRRGKRIAPEREAMVHFAGMVVLLTFAAVITFFDISRIWQGEGIIR